MCVKMKGKRGQGGDLKEDRKMQKNPMPLEKRRRRREGGGGGKKLRRKMEGGEAGLNPNGMEGQRVRPSTWENYHTQHYNCDGSAILRGVGSWEYCRTGLDSVLSRGSMPEERYV
jgi:hypothetical protein